MPLLQKISDKLHSGGKNSDETTTAAPGTGSEAAFTSGSGSGYDQSSSTATSSSSEYGADGQRKKGLGEKAKEAVGLDPKDGRDPKDIGYGNSSTSGYNQDSSSYGSDETRGINRQSERMGDLSVSNSERAQQHTAAPVVQERVHDQYNNVDRTRVEELHDRTKVQQTVQPVYDERTEGTQRERKDHGLEVHEHGSAGLDTRTEAELAAKRQQLASEHRSTHDERTSERSARPDVNVERRTNTVEEVVPVLERDVYRPHEIEHNKRVVNIHHERPQVSGTQTNQPMSAREWEQEGHNIGTGTTAGTSSSYGTYSTSYDQSTQRHKGIGEKAKEVVGLDPKDGRDPKDTGYNSNQSTYNQSGPVASSGSGATGYGNTCSSTDYNQSGTSSTTGYNQDSSSSYGAGTGTSSSEYGADGQRKKGLGEKAKEAVGLDPKDGRDPKDIGYNNNNDQSSTTGYNTGSSSTTGTTGYNQGSTSSTGYTNTNNNQSGLSGYDQSGSTTGTTGYNSGATGYNQNSSTTGTSSGLAVEDDSTETHRKKGFGEKIKEKLGLDPKDGRDPKDGDYNTRA